MSNVASWTVRRGRQDELEKTGTGEATIVVHDFDGEFDPSNLSSPYFGNLDGKPVALSMWNPVTETWHTRFTGSVEGYEYDHHPTADTITTTIRCVDAFDYLANAEMAPGIHGFLPLPATVEAGNIFYEDAEVDDRILGLLSDAQWPLAKAIVFSGNVVVQETIYDPGYSFLAGIMDAADAEFPGVANVYVDAEGNVVFHGRFARFTPDDVALTGNWNFRRWDAGDGAAILVDPTLAQIRPPLTADRNMKMVINSALVTPLDMAEEDIPEQVSTDATSITNYGVRSWSATDIRILEHKTNGNTAKDETKLMADYYVANYADPRTRPRQITFKALPPDDPRAEATWELMCGVEISDIVHLATTHPGGGGFDEDFYVEGISIECRPLGPFTPTGGEYTYAEVTLDVSPAAYYATDVFSAT